MGVFCDKLMELSVVHSMEKDRAKERAKELEEMRKLKEVLSSQYLSKCASEYEKYITTSKECHNQRKGKQCAFDSNGNQKSC